MPRILVTNDDGVHAEGIRVLAEALRPFGDVTIVAPIQEASAIGHALTLRRPLRIETIGPKVFAIDGTPTDCVNIAITHVLAGKPDLIVSGINKGFNLGDDVRSVLQAPLVPPENVADTLTVNVLLVVE